MLELFTCCFGIFDNNKEIEDCSKFHFSIDYNTIFDVYYRDKL